MSPIETMTATEIIDLLQLVAHPEGGFYRQSFADAPGPDGRARSTLIYYMLTDRQAGAWHRVDAAEVWHFYAGAPLLMKLWEGTGPVQTQQLGTDLVAGARPQFVIPPHAWQRAETLGDWTLVGCTVAPGFEFARFEQAPDDWEPGQPLP